MLPLTPCPHTTTGRFELPDPCGSLAFQASALDHYATLSIKNGDTASDAAPPPLYREIKDGLIRVVDQTDFAYTNYNWTAVAAR